MKKIILSVILVSVVLFQLLMLCGCSKSNGLQSKLSTGKALSSPIECATGNPVAQCGTYTMYLDNNMTVRIEDEKTGATYTTNGYDYENNRSDIQFVLSYYTANAAYSEMNSFEDSVEKGQATAYFSDGSLFVDYKLGNYNKTVNDVPNTLNDDRFKEKFLDKLSSSDAENFKSYYKYYEENNQWILKSKGRNHFEDILSYMAKVGYTEEDLAYDNKLVGIDYTPTSSPQFRVVLMYRLTQQGLSVTIPYEYIEFNADYPLYDIKLFQNFGLETQSGTGTILLPDGCGALMNYATNATAEQEVSLPVYGLDLSVASDVYSVGQYNYEDCNLPIFGVNDGVHSYFAHITSGAERATVKASPAGETYNRNVAYFVFRMVNKDNIYLSGSDNSSKVVLFQNSLPKGDCTVEYSFLPDGSDYADMAEFYRNILLKDGTLKVLDGQLCKESLLIETVGAVKTRKNQFGFSHVGLEAATTYEQSGRIAEDLLSEGLDSVDIKMLGWFNGGYYNNYAAKVSLNKVLGGKSAWEELLEFAKENAVDIYPDIDFQSVPSSKNGFSGTADSARRLDSSEAKKLLLSRATLLERDELGLGPTSLYLVRPVLFYKELSSFAKKYAKLSTGALSLRSTAAYSDFRDGQTTARGEAVAEICRALTVLDGINIMSGHQYQYLMPYCQVLSGVTTDCSHFTAADTAVPFLQLVYHGSAKMYSAPVNLSQNPKQEVLRAIEYGVLLNYQITYAESSVLKNSEYTDNYSSGYVQNRSDIIENGQANITALKGLTGRKIIGHEKLAEGLFCTEYDNGTIIYVNYTESDRKVGDKTVQAENYLRVEKAGDSD